jgi:hypothetical protein
MQNRSGEDTNFEGGGNRTMFQNVVFKFFPRNAIQFVNLRNGIGVMKRILIGSKRVFHVRAPRRIFALRHVAFIEIALLDGIKFGAPLICFSSRVNAPFVFAHGILKTCAVDVAGSQEWEFSFFVKNDAKVVIR